MHFECCADAGAEEFQTNRRSKLSGEHTMQKVGPWEYPAVEVSSTIFCWPDTVNLSPKCPCFKISKVASNVFQLL